MFTNLSYKKKVMYAGVLALLLIFASFKKNIKKIITVNRQLHELQASQLENKDFNKDILALKTEINLIEQYIGGVDVRPENVQQQLITFISGSPLEVDIMGIERIHHSDVNQFNIHTNQITVSGDYKNLISLLDQIEKDFKVSKITNAQFFTKTDYKRNRKELFLTLLFQNYEKA